MNKVFLLLIIIVSLSATAQEKGNKWDLRKCVDYATKNNISVKQADVQARISALQFKQAKYYQYPTSSFSTSAGYQFGRSIDPTTNEYTTTQLISQGLTLQGGAEIYNWGKLKNNTIAAQLSAKAALVDVEKVANDVSLNVATYYLQVLASKEQINICTVQIAQTKEQLDETDKKVKAGALPELNLVEIEAQLATDSSNYISAQATYEQNLLSLEGLLNVDAAKPFDIEETPVEKIPLEPLTELQPDIIYQIALNNQPLQRSNALKTKSAQKSILSNKASLYPSLSGYYSLASTYNNQAVDINQSGITNTPYGQVNVAGTNYTVYIPYPNYTYSKTNYTDQLNENFRESVGVTLSVPIFNNGQYRINYEQAILNLKNMQLQQEQSDQTLKLNIYTAYSNVINALQKFNAGKHTVESSQKAYDYALKRYDIGLLSTLDLLTNQNNLEKAKIQQVANEYDYVFKMKLLEFYKGQGLKL